jgi:hypothetical protein
MTNLDRIPPSMPRLFHMSRTRSNRVLRLLNEIGAPYELTMIAPQQRRSAEHRGRHPLGCVPALELDDGSVMFESAAILRQLVGSRLCGYVERGQARPAHTAATAVTAPSP